MNLLINEKCFNCAIITSKQFNIIKLLRALHKLNISARLTNFEGLKNNRTCQGYSLALQVISLTFFVSQTDYATLFRNRSNYSLRRVYQHKCYSILARNNTRVQLCRLLHLSFLVTHSACLSHESSLESLLCSNYLLKIKCMLIFVNSAH